MHGYRPKYSWDLKSPPYTVGKGPQDDYADAVERWSDFHDLLEEKNPNRIAHNLRGTMLWSQLPGRVRDSARKIPESVLLSPNGSKAIVASVHRRDPLSVVTGVYSDFSSVVSARRGDNESLKAFESRFEAAVSRFRSHGDAISVTEPLLALMLLNGSRISESQRISILAASVTTMPDEQDFSILSGVSDPLPPVAGSSSDAPTPAAATTYPSIDTTTSSSDTTATSKPAPTTEVEKWTPLTTKDYLKHIKYSSVASVLRQSSTIPSTSRSGPTVSSASATTSNSHGKLGGKAKKKRANRMSADELSRAKLTRPSHTCYKLGHCDCLFGNE